MGQKLPGFFLSPSCNPHFSFSDGTVRNSGTCLYGVYTGLDDTEAQEAEVPVAAFPTCRGQKDELSSRFTKEFVVMFGRYHQKITAQIAVF